MRVYEWTVLLDDIVLDTGGKAHEERYRVRKVYKGGTGTEVPTRDSLDVQTLKLRRMPRRRLRRNGLLCRR